MGLLSRLSTTVQPARAQWSMGDDRWYVPSPWLGAMTQAGVRVSPELAMTLSAVWRCVSGIVGDTSTLPCQVFRLQDDGGKDRVRNHRLSYLLRWQPNLFQTAQQYFGMIIGHQLLRGNAFVELVQGPRGFADQLIPRHPDRVTKEHLPDGRPQYKLKMGAGKEDRTLSADEMMHLPDIVTFDGWLGASRVEFGLQSFGAMLATEKASQSFFSRGMTAAVVATRKGTTGEFDEIEKANLHSSLSKYASGAENNGGILLIEEDMKIEKLAIDPEQAQMLATRQNADRIVAQWFGFPGHKLEANGQTQAYAAREQANLEYVVGCLRPILINIEQTHQKDLFLDSEKEDFFTEFLMDALFRGDLKSQAEYYSKAIQFGWMNRNEVRLRSNLNPAEGLDRYLEPINMQSADPDEVVEQQKRLHDATRDPQPAQPPVKNALAQYDVWHRKDVRGAILAYELGQRIVRKEKAAVLKAAERFAKDGAGWSSWLREFYADHAGYVAETLHVPLAAARAYASEHGTVIEQQGVGCMDGWEHTVSAELAAWALEGKQAA